MQGWLLWRSLEGAHDLSNAERDLEEHKKNNNSYKALSVSIF
jgi:hypothetical protein